MASMSLAASKLAQFGNFVPRAAVRIERKLVVSIIESDRVQEVEAMTRPLWGPVAGGQPASLAPIFGVLPIALATALANPNRL